jgi:hypothetical protein
MAFTDLSHHALLAHYRVPSVAGMEVPSPVTVKREMGGRSGSASAISIEAGRGACEQRDADAPIPFEDVTAIVNNLRYERYATGGPDGSSRARRVVSRIYYHLRPWLALPVRRRLQRFALRGWDQTSFPQWPLDTTVESVLENSLVAYLQAHHIETIPFIWFWPQGHAYAAMVTHDVETGAGLDATPGLMDVDDGFGIKAAFQLIPEERYELSERLIDRIRSRGFEVNVHDLNHDGRLFWDHGEFLRRAEKINRYIGKYRACGFRSGCLYRNIDWLDALNIAYDMSVPNSAHLEAQRGGCCTVFPYFLGKVLELPVTMTQDYSLFHILRQYSTDLWRRQLSMIRDVHGLASVIVHPDYLTGEREMNVYRELLNHLREEERRNRLWLALPADVDRWWRQRAAMQLRQTSAGGWEITGKGAERATIANATLDGDRIRYSFPHGTACPERLARRPGGL